MAHNFKTKQDALAAGYRPVNRRTDADISGPRQFGYQFRNSAGEETVTVWLSEEPNQIGQPGAFLPLYPPQPAAPAVAPEVQHALLGVPQLPDARYHSPLPAELASFYCYPLDAGHSLCVVPASLVPAIDYLEYWTEYLVPVPVKTVLRLGWTIERCLPVVDVPYDPETGAVVPDQDEEW